MCQVEDFPYWIRAWSFGSFYQAIRISKSTWWQDKDAYGYIFWNTFLYTNNSIYKITLMIRYNLIKFTKSHKLTLEKMIIFLLKKITIIYWTNEFRIFIVFVNYYSFVFGRIVFLHDIFNVKRKFFHLINCIKVQEIFSSWIKYFSSFYSNEF